MPQPNDLLGPFVLLRYLDRGTFGEVWEARRSEGKSPSCAIKIVIGNEFQWKAVEKEADVWIRATGHPNIVPLIEANKYDGQVVLVSEYISGGSLRDWLEKYGGKAPSIAKAIEMMTGILSGLEHLHRLEIAHRDLKPANVLLQGETPRLTDFGLSRVLSSAQSSITAGTPAYTAPEAWDGNETRTVQSDLWAAGVILYKMLAGRLPFPQQQTPSLIKAILNDSPAPLPSDVPAPLRAVVARALEKDLDKRYQTATEMKQDLLACASSREVATEQPAQVVPPQPQLEEIALRVKERETTEEPTRVVPPLRASADVSPPAEKASALPAVSSAADSSPLEKKPTKQVPSGFMTRNKFLVLLGLLVLVIGIGLSLRKQTPQDVVDIPSPAPSASTKVTPSPTPAGYSENLGDGVMLEMVRLPGGSFQMGSTESEVEEAFAEEKRYNEDAEREWWTNEMPRHEVRVSPFFMGKYEVTQAQWYAVMGTTVEQQRDKANPNWRLVGVGDRFPMYYVSWEEAREFCRRLSERTGKVYRLPTEAEWEYACRAGTTGKYAGNLNMMAWYGDNSGKEQRNSAAEWKRSGNDPARYNEEFLIPNGNRTHVVGTKAANRFGLYDMHGNVWEWCEDVWHNSYAGAPENGSAWLSGGDSRYRVLRGGSCIQH